MADHQESRQEAKGAWIGYVAAVAAQLALTAGLLALLPIFPIAGYPVAYVAVAAVAAYLFGIGPAIAAFVIGLILYIYAYPPYHGLRPLATTQREWAGIVALALGSLIVGLAVAAMQASRSRLQVLAGELQKANRHVQETLESIAECFFAIDSEGRVIDVNRIALETVFGLPVDQVLGRTLLEACPGIAETEFEKRCRDAVLTQTQAHFEDLLCFENRWFECHVFPYGGCLEAYLRDISDRKLAEEALRDSEARYRSLVETMNEGFCTADADFVLTYANPRIAEMLGYSVEEIVGHKIVEFLDEPSRRLLEEQLTERKAGRYTQYELTWVARNGRHVRTLISPRPVFDRDGRFVGGFAAITDISELKRSVEAVQESEHKYRTLFQNANDAIFLVALTEEKLPGLFIEVNDIACERLGYTREELLRMGPQDIDSPETVSRLPDLARMIREQGHATFEVDQISKDGRRIPVEISAHVFHMGEQEVLLAIARDISERKLAQQSLLESEERFRRLFENAGDAMYLHDLEGRFVEANQSACQSLGYTREELLGLNVQDVVVNYDQATLDELWAMLSASPQTVYATHRRKDGSALLVEGRLSLLHYADQTLVLAAARDITERMKAEEERRTLEQRVEEQKRLFYRETIFSVTDGKLDICDVADIEPFLANADIKAHLRDVHEASRARHEVEEYCRSKGLEGSRLESFVIAVGEAITNAVKHGTEGTVYAGAADRGVWVGVADKGSGIESLILPRAVLLRGFSTKPSLGMGYSVMLNVADRVHLKTDQSGTIVILEKRYEDEPVGPPLGDIAD